MGESMTFVKSIEARDRMGNGVKKEGSIGNSFNFDNCLYQLKLKRN